MKVAGETKIREIAFRSTPIFHGRMLRMTFVCSPDPDLIQAPHVRRGHETIAGREVVSAGPC